MTKPNDDAKFKRYHKDVFFPENFPEMMLEFVNLFDGNDVECTSHAASKMINEKSDPRGRIPYPTAEELFDRSNRLVEFYQLEDNPDRIQKAVIRISNLSENYDYTYVVARDRTIITCWANDKGDEHRLTKSLVEYVQPSQA